VTGGGLHAAGQWVVVQKGFLLPMRVVRALFRGKLLAALRQGVVHGTLSRPEGPRRQHVEHRRHTLGRQQWTVHIRERYASGHGVLIDLARDLRGGPLSNRRLRACDGQEVVFGYEERVKGPGGQAKRRTMRRPFEQFLGRWLLPVPPPHAVLVRCWGLYAHTQGAALALCRQQGGQGPVEVPEPVDGQPDSRQGAEAEPERGPVCRQPLVCTARIPRAGAPPPAKTGWEQVAGGGARPWQAGRGPEGPRCGLQRAEVGLLGEDALQDVPAPDRFSCPQATIHGTCTSRRSATGLAEGSQRHSR